VDTSVSKEAAAATFRASAAPKMDVAGLFEVFISMY
jgi:hypothetical protein